MKYRDGNGIEYDTAQFTVREFNVFKWLLEKYQEVKSWDTYNQLTRQLVERVARESRGDEWKTHPLYWVYLDLVGNVGVREGEVEGELSDMVVGDC